MKKTMTKFMLFSMLFAGASVQAADNLKFKGNLIIPNCTINNNLPLETNFGNVEIQKLVNENTGYYSQLIQVRLNCPYNIKTPKISITGSAAAKTSNGIQTSKYNTEKLVVWLRTSDASHGWGEAITINGNLQKLPAAAITGTGANKTLYLTASVGREGGMDLLTPGPFTASANMQVRYE
ncbi:fimbrial protein [Escherichia coli]|nr:fimbrial protein [Escherichia coli]EGF1582119.1 fimbrial protein [Escherichia coli]EGF1717755.1 fimbrial protein [Escherichia coli]